ncbi:MAG TPA: hypothetical protein V6C81_00220 [Planktothrix sp.]|jgi:hypothetical protein
MKLNKFALSISKFALLIGLFLADVAAVVALIHFELPKDHLSFSEAVIGFSPFQLYLMLTVAIRAMAPKVMAANANIRTPKFSKAILPCTLLLVNAALIMAWSHIANPSEPLSLKEVLCGFLVSNPYVVFYGLIKVMVRKIKAAMLGSTQKKEQTQSLPDVVTNVPVTAEAAFIAEVQLRQQGAPSVAEHEHSICSCHNN